MSGYGSCVAQAQLLHGTWDLLSRLGIEPESPSLAADSLPLSHQGSPQPSLSIASYFPMIKELPSFKKPSNSSPSSSSSFSLLFSADCLNLLFPCPNFPLITEPIPNWLLPYYLTKTAPAKPRSPWPPSTSLNQMGIFEAVPYLTSQQPLCTCAPAPRCFRTPSLPPYSTTPDSSGFSPLFWSLLLTPVQRHFS